MYTLNAKYTLACFEERAKNWPIAMPEKAVLCRLTFDNKKLTATIISQKLQFFFSNSEMVFGFPYNEMKTFKRFLAIFEENIRFRTCSIEVVFVIGWLVGGLYMVMHRDGLVSLPAVTMGG